LLLLSATVLLIVLWRVVVASMTIQGRLESRGHPRTTQGDPGEPQREPPVDSSTDLRALLEALRGVETGWVLPSPRGDGGDAIGPYQVHESYWVDAVAFDSTLRSLNGRPAKWEDCADLAYSTSVVLAYLGRWVPDALDAVDWSVLSRTHNGGPRGATRDATLPYWDRVRSIRTLSGNSSCRPDKILARIRLSETRDQSDEQEN